MKRKKEREEQDALEEDEDIAEAALEGPDDEYVWHFPTEEELEKEGDHFISFFFFSSRLRSVFSLIFYVPFLIDFLLICIRRGRSRSWRD